jgi:mannose-1-phosphate guanylyltransferase
MKALVLAAGRGERVRPLSETVPKPMLEVGGHPLIHYVLAMLRRGGVNAIVINVHHLAAAIQRGLGNGARFGMEVIYSPEPTLFGTGGPLNALAGYFAGEPFVIANSDGILDLDLEAMLRFHREQGAAATLALCRPEGADLYSRIEIDRGSRVRRMRLLNSRSPRSFDEYPPELGAIDARALEAFMYCGVLVAEASVLELMPKSPPWSVMAGLFAPMVAEGLPVFGFVHRGYFRTVDDLESYHALKREFETSPPHLEFAAPA